MMRLSDAELADFRMRCIQATQLGFSVGLADGYMEALEAEGGSVETSAVRGSPAYLAEMASVVMGARAPKEPEPEIVPEPEVAAPVPEPKVEEHTPTTLKIEELIVPAAEEPLDTTTKADEDPVPPAPKSEKPASKKALAPAPKAEEPVVSKKGKKTEPAPKKEEVVPVSYDTWTFDDLYAEAQKRKIPNRSKMPKDELIAVLEAYDAEKG